MHPHVTIMIAAWNAENSLPKAIAAARQQDEITAEIIVADDASTDNTAGLIETLTDVKYIRLPQNQGPSAARNAALAAATAEWVAVLDADDAMTPGRLDAMLAQATRHKADVVLGNFLRVDAAGRAIDDAPFLDPAQIKPSHSLTLEEYVSHNLLAPGERSYGYLKPLFRRDFLQKHGIRYDTALRNSEDYHIVLACLAAGGRVLVAPKADYLYRVSAGSISHIVPPDKFDALLRADRAFRHAQKGGSARLQRLLQRRERNLLAMLHSEEIMFALKSRRVGQALNIAARHVHALPLLGSKLTEAAGKRLRRVAG